MKVLISRVALSICGAYAFEAFLLCVAWFEVPGLATVAGFLQIPSIAWALGMPPPEIAPNGERDLFALMFLDQGFIFSLIALGVQFLIRRVRLLKASGAAT